MKTWIILGLITAMAGALCNLWQQHEMTSPVYKQALGRQLTDLHKSHPDWANEQLAHQVATEQSRNAMLRFLIVWAIVLVLFIILFWRFGAHWWYVAVAFVLSVGASVWIANL
jgi:hypothetical protein